MSLKLVLLYAMLLSVLYHYWSRAIVQSACTYDDLTLTIFKLALIPDQLAVISKERKGLI